MSTRRLDTGSRLTHGVILMLSGFLIGMVAGDVVPARLESVTVLSGLAGLVSYLALGYLARQRAVWNDRRAARRANTRMLQRLNRHIPRLLPAPHRRRIKPEPYDSPLTI